MSTELGFEVVPLIAFPQFRDLFDRIADAQIAVDQASYAEKQLMARLASEVGPSLVARNDEEYKMLLAATVNAHPEKVDASECVFASNAALLRLLAEERSLSATLLQRQVEAFEGRRRWLDIKVIDREDKALFEGEA